MLLTDDKIYVANAGDSRSILVRKDEVVELSKDHKPELKSEKARIKKCGGWVTANNRINGELNISRGFGDFRFKDNRRQYNKRIVTCEPDIKELSRRKRDKFIIMGSDGFWDIENIDFYETRSTLKSTINTMSSMKSISGN